MLFNIVIKKTLLTLFSSKYVHLKIIHINQHVDKIMNVVVSEAGLISNYYRNVLLINWKVWYRKIQENNSTVAMFHIVEHDLLFMQWKKTEWRNAQENFMFY